MTLRQPLDDLELSARDAQAKAAQAYSRLLYIAETTETGQARRIAQFLASCHNGNRWPFDLFELRAVDVEIGDDMLACLDALRWAKADLYQLVPEGERRIERLLTEWGLVAPQQGAK